MVHDSRARVRALTRFIVESTGCTISGFEVSDVKRDDTVFVKFRSGTAPGETACDRACRLSLALQDAGRQHTCPTDVQIRVAIELFEP